MAYIYDLADVWASSGTTFTGIKLSVTDTASAAGSLLMDLQVGGVSRFSVSKTGAVTTPGSLNAGVDIYWTRDLYALSSTARITWTGGLSLHQDAANTLAQRNGVNAQAFNLYNTYTDASNYERGFMRFVSNTLRIGTEKLGTGATRGIDFQVDGITRLSVNTGGSVIVGAAIYGATGSTYIGWTNSALMTSPSVGVIRLNNFAETDFNRVQFGGTTSSFPSIKRSTTSLQARLADDSAFTNIQGKLTTDTAYTAGAPTATGYIVLFDSAGTAYKVPAEAL